MKKTPDSTSLGATLSGYVQLANLYFNKVALMYGCQSSTNDALVTPPVGASMSQLKASDQIPLISSSFGLYDHGFMGSDRTEMMTYLKNLTGPQKLMRQVLIGVDELLDEPVSVPTVPLYGQFSARFGVYSQESGLYGLFVHVLRLSAKTTGVGFDLKLETCERVFDDQQKFMYESVTVMASPQSRYTLQEQTHSGITSLEAGLLDIPYSVLDNGSNRNACEAWIDSMQSNGGINSLFSSVIDLSSTYSVY